MPKSFLSGELDTTQIAYADQKYYYSAVRKADGWIVIPEGGATMAPGTIYTARTKSDVKVRLEVFIYSEDDVYVLEFGPLYIRFYRNNLQVGAPTEVATTYTASEIWELDISVQLADTLYITHGNHQRAKLVRSSHTSWTLSDLAMTDGPFRDENTTSGTIAASAITGSGVTLTAAGGATPFTLTTDVGSIWRLNHEVAEVEQSGTFTSVSNGNSVYVQRDSQWRVVLIPGSSWDGTISLQFSTDDTTWWTDQSPITGSNTDRQTLNGIAEDRDLYVRLICSARTSGSCEHYLYANSYVHIGIAKITAVASTTSATATILKDLASTNATTLWSEGSWSATRGFPTTSFFYANRLCYAGNAAQPQHIWCSAQNDFEVNRAGVKDTDAFQQPLDGALASPIRWVRVEDKGIVVGTLGQVLLYFPQDSTLSAKPTNPFTKRTGAAHPNGFIPPVEVGGSYLLTELGGKAVKELLFSKEDASLITPDLTRFAKHLMHVDNANGIVDVAFQRRPYHILWCVRSDGVLLALSYDRNIDLVAWTRVPTTGTVESVAVIPKGNYDQVWIASLHTINGSEVRFVSYMDELDIRKPLKDMCFVEAGLRWSGGTASITAATQANPCVITVDTWPTDGDGNNLSNGDNIRITGVVGMTELNNLVYEVANVNVANKTMELKDSEGIGNIDSTGFTAWSSGGTVEEVDNSFSGASHIANESAKVVYNGVSSEDITVAADGTLTTTDWVTSVVVGLYSPRECYLLPYEEPTTLGRSKHVVGQLLAVYRTIGGSYGPMNLQGVIDPARTRQIDWSRVFDPWAWSDYEYTGIKHITENWGTAPRHTMVIQQNEPLPMTLLSVEPEIAEVS